MNSSILKIVALFLLLFSMTCNADQTPNLKEPSSTLQITLETTLQGKPAAMIINAKGVKTDLTLGTLLQATAESWMNGPLPSPPIASNTIAVIKIYKQGDNLVPYIQDKQGNTKALNLGSLLAGSTSDYTGCTPTQMNGKSLVINLIFKTDPSGAIATYYEGTQGEELFNLGILVRDTALVLNQCKGHDLN